MKWLVLHLARILGRFRFWVETVFVLSRLTTLGSLPEDFRTRLGYACLMSSRDPRTRRMVAGLIRRQQHSSAQTHLFLGRLCWCLGELRLAALIFRRAGDLPATPTERTLSLSLAAMAESILDGSIYATVAASLDELGLPAPGPVPIILTPVSSGYLNLFSLWQRQVDEHVGGHQVLLALDGLVESSLPENGSRSVLDLSPYFVYDDAGKMTAYSKCNLWILRVMVLKELVARGYTVLSLDLDAIVVGDLHRMVLSMPAADVVAQTDFSIPIDVARKHGFIVCCGFMFFRPGSAVDRFFIRYCDSTVREMDDQLSLNHLLMQEGMHDVVTSPSHKTFSSLGLKWVCPDPSLVSRDLRHGSVIRHFQQVGASIDTLQQAMGISAAPAPMQDLLKSSLPCAS